MYEVVTPQAPVHSQGGGHNRPTGTQAKKLSGLAHNLTLLPRQNSTPFPIGSLPEKCEVVLLYGSGT